MAYKPLTKKGEDFILNRCIANSAFGNNRFSGKRKFPLPKSTTVASTVWTAVPRDESNAIITTAEGLAKNLISWFNRYSSDYLLDANIIAAQAYAESGYNLWIYSDGGAMGLCQFLDAAVFDTVIKNRQTFKDDIDDLTVGMNFTGSDNKDIRYYIPNFSTRDKSIVSTPQTTAIARTNRAIFFQNIINNPKIMIKAQCYLMKYIGNRNTNLASSALFAYNRGSGLQSTSYDNIVDKTAKRYGKPYIGQGVEYVARIFNLLAGQEPQVPVGFGYEINFTPAQINFSSNETIQLTSNIKLNQTQEGYIRNLHPVAQDTFRNLIANIEKNTPFKVTITSGYRTFAEQERIKKENDAKGRPASNPGSSYHNYGLGLDIALESKTSAGLTYSFNKTVSEWNDTGVPSIGIALGLRWGGNFNDTDVVHFDMGNTYEITECKTLAANTYGSDPNKVLGNQIPLVA